MEIQGCGMRISPPKKGTKSGEHPGRGQEEVLGELSHSLPPGLLCTAGRSSGHSPSPDQVPGTWPGAHPHDNPLIEPQGRSL